MGADVNRGERPLSPHLSVYRMPLAGLLSISHRITGAAMAGGALLLVWWFIAAASGPEYFALVDGLLTSWIGHLVMLGMTLSIMFHLCNGIRHLIWDAGKGLDIEEVNQSGRWALIGAAVLTVLIFIIGIWS